MILILLIACGDKEGDTGAGEGEVVADAAAIREIAAAAQWAEGVSATIDGDTLTFESDGVPDHAVLDEYAAFTAEGVTTASILAQGYRMEITLAPEIAASPSETSTGPVGPAISGAVFYNPYDATGEYANEITVDSDLPFMDECGGHPTPEGGQYHYHGVPYCTVAAVDVSGEHSRVIGFLSDGFPLYGPLGEGGAAPTDLDACNGHTGHVPETEAAVYHYHTSTQRPYVPECYTGVPQVSGGSGGPPPTP